MAVKNLADLLAEGVEGRGVLVRCDLNVPLDENGTVTDTGRIDASVPTLKALSDAGAKVIVTAHLGRPKGGPEPKYSLAPVAKVLAAKLDRHVQLAGDVVGTDALARAEALAVARGVRLTPVRRRVLEILLEEHKAMGAYDVLTRLAAEGFGNQPPVAYRALEAGVALRHGCPYVANIQEAIIGRRCCWGDANHPNEMGNRHVADSVEPILEKLLATRAQPVRKPVLQTTRDFWREAVALAPNALAVVDGDRRLTYCQADRLVECIAAALVRRTGVASPKVAVFLPNCLEYFLVYWATARLGGIIVPLNTWLKADSLRAIFESVRPDFLLVRSGADREPLEAAAAQPPRAVGALEAGAGNLVPWQEMLAAAPAAPWTDLAPDAPSIVMHTSGTTAAPKGAVMRHADLLFNVIAAINAHQFCASDVHLLVNPMFHCTALYSSLPTAAYTKTPVVIASPTNPRQLMEVVQRERITTFLSVPSVFQQLLKVPDLASFDASSLRVIAYAGSAMPVSAIRELHARFPNVALHNFFGLTETISMTHVLGGEEAEQRPDSIGRLLPFVEAVIVDEHGVRLPAGQVGELLFARENVIPGYYNMPGMLDEAIVTVEGRAWFRTGDLAVIDAEGYFFIKGRKKDMIIVGGENVYAVEVEAVLMSHDGVHEAAVKGEPATGAAAFLGERVKAYVVRRDDSVTERDLREHCTRRLPSYKVPHRIVFMDVLPRNPAGKVVKAELP
jgi:acyl-CoA synthetase (AMP-forming)/AMP-acid ligase II